MFVYQCSAAGRPQSKRRAHPTVTCAAERPRQVLSWLASHEGAAADAILAYCGARLEKQSLAMGRRKWEGRRQCVGIVVIFTIVLFLPSALPLAPSVSSSWGRSAAVVTSARRGGLMHSITPAMVHALTHAHAMVHALTHSHNGACTHSRTHRVGSGPANAARRRRGYLANTC